MRASALVAFGVVVSFFYPFAAIGMYLLTPLTLLFPVSVKVENEDDREESDAEKSKVKL